MKKVILRLIIVALAIALVVLILLNTVFKVSSTQKAYNSLNEAFSTKGSITSMTSELHDLNEFNSAYGNYVVVFEKELKNLQASYPKLYFLKGVDDEAMSSVTTKLEEMQKSLQEATKIIKEVNEGKKANSDLDVSAYIETLKPKIIKALGNVIDLNCNIQDFLTTSYYNGEYFEKPFLTKLEAYVAKEYFAFASGDGYNSEISEEIYNFYNYLIEHGFDTSTIEKTNILHSALDKVKDVNLFRILDNIKEYKKENESNADLIAKIDFVAEFINSVSAEFNVNDIVIAREAQ